jgi:phosphocarrier protein HPr
MSPVTGPAASAKAGQPDPSVPLRIARCTIVNSRGLHARAAAKFVRLAATFDAEVTVERDGARVPATSILGLMMLGASRGAELEMAAEGEQAEAALAALVALVEHGFDETD